MGLSFNPDFNAESTLGVGRIQTFVDTKDTARSNSEKAFLSADVLARPNLTVLTSARALKVIVENGKCTGAVVLHHGEEATFHARKQVVVSCGAFDSPRILHASNIPLPGIGKNLQDHLGINISFKLPSTFDPSLETIDCYNGQLNRYLILFKYLMYRQGPAASNIGEAVAFYRTKLPSILTNDPSSGAQSPHVELIAVPGLTHHHEGQMTPAAKRIRPDFDWGKFEFKGRYVTLIALLLNPFSRGEIRFGEAGMDIDPNYLEDGRDVDVMVEGVKFIREIVREGYVKVGIEGMEECLPGEHVQTEEGIASFIRDNSETYYHPVGTCKVHNGEDVKLIVDGIEV